MPNIPCPTCAGTAWASHEDRHARTAKDVCPTCKGEGTVEAQTGIVRSASFDPATGRPFGKVRAADGGRS